MYPIDGIVWLLILSVALAVLQKRLHSETQSIFYLLTGRKDIALVLFSLLFFPGVLLHEVSHFVVARLLGIRTGRLSLLPQPLPDGRLRLGYVETASADIFRDSLIGGAPLLLGGLFVAYAGMVHLGIPALWDRFIERGFSILWQMLSGLSGQPDFWLWFYLIFAVSSTMLPSASDRRAWAPVVVGILVAGIVLFLVSGSWLDGLWASIIPKANQTFRTISLVFGISSTVHAILLPPLWLMRKSLSRIRKFALL